MSKVPLILDELLSINRLTCLLHSPGFQWSRACCGQAAGARCGRHPGGRQRTHSRRRRQEQARQDDPAAGLGGSHAGPHRDHPRPRTHLQQRRPAPLTGRTHPADTQEKKGGSGI